MRVIPIELQRLFARLLLLNSAAASTAPLTDSFGWTNREELVQHDVQELNRCGPLQPAQLCGIISP